MCPASRQDDTVASCPPAHWLVVHDNDVPADGYRTSDVILKAVEENEDIRNNLSAAAHLMHGSPEDRFTVTYCPGHISKEDVESVGFNYGDLAEMSSKYDITKLQDGFNDVDGERVFYISNPALGNFVSLACVPRCVLCCVVLCLSSD